MLRLVSLLLLFLTVAAPAWAEPAPSSSALDRGNLSLAWDAHDSGLCREALAYLDEIPASSPLVSQAAWLRAECWSDLGEYAQAAAALAAPEAAGVEGRGEFLLDIYWDQVLEATGRGALAEAQDVLARARDALPGDPDLAALTAATGYRQRIAADLAATGKADAAARLLDRGRTPPGEEGWIEAYPWTREGDWVPQTTAAEWLPGVAAGALAAGQSLWLRVPEAALAAAVAQAAAAAGMALRAEAWGWSAGYAGEWFPLVRAEWRFRAAVEGLGVEGAARFALREAAGALPDQAALTAWVDSHRGNLRVARVPEGLRLSHPDSGRGFTLEPWQWLDAFREVPEEWEQLWRDLTVELGRPARPYRCFCGRPVVLREALLEQPGPLLVVGQEGAAAVVVAALCPEHQRYVDAEVAQEWGVSAVELAARARADAVANPWQLSFGRGEVEGVPYLFLEGEGAAALPRVPSLLLGALERADGYGVRGTTVRVFAATESTLVVARSDGPEGTPRLAATRLLLEQARQGAPVDGGHLAYGITLQLPSEPEGTFQLTPVE